MAKCDVCGNDYDKAFSVTAAGTKGDDRARERRHDRGVGREEHALAYGHA